MARTDRSGWVPFETGEAYFANSFRLIDPPPEDWGYAESDYGGNFLSSVWRGRTLACQFHPELSGQWGRTVLENWIERESADVESIEGESIEGEKESC